MSPKDINKENKKVNFLLVFYVLPDQFEVLNKKMKRIKSSPLF